jgi:hypothetical protein
MLRYMHSMDPSTQYVEQVKGTINHIQKISSNEIKNMKNRQYNIHRHIITLLIISQQLHSIFRIAKIKIRKICL